MRAETDKEQRTRRREERERAGRKERLTERRAETISTRRQRDTQCNSKWFYK